jgi:hypothetical protein
MIFSRIFKTFNGERKFQNLESEADDDTDIEAENLLRNGHVARQGGISNALIYFTATNVVILIITASSILSTGTFRTSEKNAVLRPISWWCKSNSVDCLICS